MSLICPSPRTPRPPWPWRTQAALTVAGRLAWTPAQQATAAACAQLVDAGALCGYLAQQLDYTPARCDHTFRHVGSFLAAHPVPGVDDAALFTMLSTLGIHCDCGYVINVCMR